MNTTQKIIEFELFKKANENDGFTIDYNDYIDEINDESNLFKRYYENQNDEDVQNLYENVENPDIETLYEQIPARELFEFRKILLKINSEQSVDYFTISSKKSFNDLTFDGDSPKYAWKNSKIFTPLNDHSRRILKKGDVLFCNRFGQFESLSDALDSRGIYGVGIALTDPQVFYPDKSGHKKYGVVVSFPFSLNHHLTTRNIQMNPITIDLTPYNGNRNDALQHILDKNKALELLKMLLVENERFDDFFKIFYNINIPKISILPNNYLQKKYRTLNNVNILTEKLNVEKLKKDLSLSYLHIDENLIYRFISALCTKPFIILTGLSGSGKTKLAQAFAYWITSQGNLKESKKRFSIGEKINSDRVVYQVVSSDEISVTFQQTETNKKVNLPYELMDEWISIIIEKNFSRETPPRTIREAVAEKTTYSTQLNSFETHLKASAFYLLETKKNEPEDLLQYVILPVGSDWTNREPLLGFPNSLEPGKYFRPDNKVIDLIIEAGKEENSDKPFFLILDEMNLSHVERYFADFLSVMESGEKISLHPDVDWNDDIPAELVLPPNLFIIGTVNIDETTYMFSPKVLDRAHVIEFRVSNEEMESFLKEPLKPELELLRGLGKNMAADFILKSQTEISDFDDFSSIESILLDFFKELKKIGAEFGYRTASEIYHFGGMLKKLTNENGNEWPINDIVDAAVIQKLLPKVHGSRSKLEPVLKTLAELCLSNKDDFDAIVKSDVVDYKDRTKIKYPLSLEKIIRMRTRVIQDGFTSFTEA